MIKYISESLYPFEFQRNKLIKYFKEKNTIQGYIRTITSMCNSTTQIVKTVKSSEDLQEIGYFLDVLLLKAVGLMLKSQLIY